MKKLQVLVATMEQKDFSKIQSMNIVTDVIFANQTSEKTEYKKESINGCVAELISTQTKGVGKNRNIAISHASADILLFADDDIRYLKDYSKKIITAFEKLPKADIIVFNLTKDADRYMIRKIRRVRWFNFMRYGAVRIAIRHDSLLKANLSFSQLFGGGALYGSGEDSMFLADALKKHLKIYSYPEEIAELTNERKSTWFNGDFRKLLYDKGAWLAANYPIKKRIFKFYFAEKLYLKAGVSRKKAIRLIEAGIKGYPALRNYDKFMKKYEDSCL